MKPLIIFDLDGTLTESKQSLSDEMALYVGKLLSHTKVAITSGAGLPQFLKQVVGELPSDAHLSNLYLLPTSGAALYEYKQGEWIKVYEERLSEKEAELVKEAITRAVEKTGLITLTDASWGDRIEYRGGQVTLSALGQHAPIALKKEWDPDHKKRHTLRLAIAEALPDYSVSVGGATSVDVSKHGIDKAYGIHKLCERLQVREADALYIGDELESGGNDEPVYKTGVATCVVHDPHDTLRVIQNILSLA